MRRILIRADDLGYSEAVNYGIEKSCKDGIINNVGVMVNMDATDHGVNLLKGEDICFGLHTNICIGKPITDPNLIPSLVDENGEFKKSSVYRNAKEDFVVLDEVVMEIEAQYHKFKELFNAEPEYFEGHAVSSPNFFKGLDVVAKKYGLKNCAIAFDGSQPYCNDTKVYMCLDSMSPNYDPFYSFKKMCENYHDDGVDIMVCHPGYLDDYILKNSSLTIPRTQEVAMCCDEKTFDYIKENKIELLTYNDI